MKELTVLANTENLEQVLEFVNSFLEENNCPKDVMVDIDIAVEELFVNIAYYAYIPETGQATVQIFLEEKRVTVVFIDGGIPYNPWVIEDPDITLSAEERRIGGLGIYMVKKSMDEVDYRYEDEKNIVIIRKKISGDCKET